MLTSEYATKVARLFYQTGERPFMHRRTNSPPISYRENTPSSHRPASSYGAQHHISPKSEEKESPKRKLFLKNNRLNL